MRCSKCGSTCFEEDDDGGMQCCHCGHYVKPHIVKIIKDIEQGGFGNTDPSLPAYGIFACARTLR